MTQSSHSASSGSSAPARRGTSADRNTHDEEPLLTVDEVAAILNVTRVWVYERARTREIVSGKLGKHLRFRRADVLRYRDAAFSGSA
jgi:excisionase family DNA binding protein